MFEDYEIGYKLCVREYSKPNTIWQPPATLYKQRRWAEYNLKKMGDNFVDYEKGFIQVHFIAGENEPPFENVWNYSRRDFVAFLIKYHVREINKPKDMVTF